MNAQIKSVVLLVFGCVITAGCSDFLDTRQDVYDTMDKWPQASFPE